MKISNCAIIAIRQIEAGIPKINLDEQEFNKLKSLAIFFFLAVVVALLNRLGR